MTHLDVVAVPSFDDAPQFATSRCVAAAAVPPRDRRFIPDGLWAGYLLPGAPHDQHRPRLRHFGQTAKTSPVWQGR